jgi:hypothetical protein
MSGLYTDITGIVSVTAAKTVVEDFGGGVLGAPIEVLSADHQNKPDGASATAREWFEIQQVDAILDVAASATAPATTDVAKEKHKIIVVNGPSATRVTNEACTPVSIYYVYDNDTLSRGTGEAVVKAGCFFTADYALGRPRAEHRRGSDRTRGLLSTISSRETHTFGSTGGWCTMCISTRSRPPRSPGGIFIRSPRPADETFMPLSQSRCSLAKHQGR